MKFAVSNIAWDISEDSRYLSILQEFGIKNLEIAPTKFWPKPTEVSENEAKSLLEKYNKMGFELVGMQSLLFGQPELSIFGNTNVLADTFEYLKKIVRLASWLGVHPLVFGSPKNRLKKDMQVAEAMNKASIFFKKLGDYANSLNACICIEANAKFYECDFINQSNESFELVEMTKSKGFGLHLDLGNMILENENIHFQLQKLLPYAQHFHLSAPNLKPIYNLKEHALNKNIFQNYNKTVSVEMVLNDPSLNRKEEFRKSIEYLTDMFL